jgi:hypothetical protein
LLIVISLISVNMGICAHDASFVDSETDLKWRYSPRKRTSYEHKGGRSSSFLSISNSKGRVPDFTSQSDCESPKSSTNSSYFDSLDTDDFFAFDGLNKRITNRYEIGLEMLKAQIHFGSDPKVLSTHGDRTCLMFSVMANDYRFTKKLVELGVDINQTNSLGETALGLAIELKRKDIANYLRSKGAFEEVTKVQ